MLFSLFTITNYIQATAAVATSLCPWPPSHLQGRQPLNRTEFDYCTLGKINSFMDSASYSPEHCHPRQNIAVIVPYRDREPQLKLFLLNVLPKIKRENLSFSVFIIEQSGQDLFNKGALINIGFLEAIKNGNFDCFVIHDVDILTEDDRNLYTCGENPRNLAVLVEQFNYSLFHSEYLGGIVTFTKEQFRRMNGFSNMYKGWGIEDDDAYRRIRSVGYKLDRPENNVGFCGSIKHKKAFRQNDRCWYFMNYGRYWKYDGLKSIEYDVVETIRTKLVYWLITSFDTNQMRQKVKSFASRVNKSLLPQRYPSNKDGYCAWFLNQQLFSTKTL